MTREEYRQKYGVEPNVSPLQTPVKMTRDEYLQKYGRMPVIPSEQPKTLGGKVNAFIKDVTSPVAKVLTNLTVAGQQTANLGRAILGKQTKEYDNVVDLPYWGKTRTFGTEGNFGQKVKESLGVGAELASFIPAGRAATPILKAGWNGIMMQGIKTGAREGLVGGALQGGGRAATDNRSLSDIAIETGIGGASGALFGGAIGGVIPLARNIPVGIGRGVVKAQTSVMPTEKQAIGILKKGYDDIFGATKTGMKNVEKSSAGGKNTSQFLANKKIIPDVTPEGKIDTFNARSSLWKDIDTIDKDLTSKLKESGRVYNLKDLKATVISAIDNIKTQAEGSVTENKEAIERLFDEYSRTFGDLVPLDTLNEIKRAQIRKSKVFDATKPRFMSNIEYQVGKAAMKAIEEIVPEAKLINKYYGDHLDAIDMLKKVHGNTIKGGKLGHYFGQAIGGMVGTTAGAMVGGPLGAVAGGGIGTVVGNELTKSLGRAAIAPSAVRRVLSR